MVRLGAAALAWGLTAMVLAAALPLASSAGHAQQAAPRHLMPTVSAWRAGGAGADPAPDANNLIYHHGPIEKAPKVYLVFWGWLGGALDPDGIAPYLQAFFNGVGGSPWAAIQTQYGEDARGNITNPEGQLAGVWFDDLGLSGTDLPPVIPDAQLDMEARNAAAHFGYDADADYIIATPTHRSTFGFGLSYCAYHTTTTDGAGRVIAYTDLPYMTDAGGSCGENFVNGGNAGKLDGVSIVGGHEYAEAVTDPQLNAWYDSNGAENGDKCAWVRSGSGAARDIHLPTGDFAVQSLWSNALGDCTTTYP